MQAAGRPTLSFGNVTYPAPKQPDVSFGGVNVRRIGTTVFHKAVGFDGVAPNALAPGYNLNRPAPTMFTGKKLDFMG